MAIAEQAGSKTLGGFRGRQRVGVAAGLEQRQRAAWIAAQRARADGRRRRDRP
jgi:hypothetical protein